MKGDLRSGPLRTALFVGHVASTLPVVLIVSVALILMDELPIAAVAIWAAAWLWWSIVTPRWRSWALRSGADPVALQRWGLWTGLVWPKGMVFERTEIFLSDRAFYGLLGALFLATFVTIETLTSEYLERLIPLPGVLSPLLGAGIAAAVLLPVHNSLRRFLRRSQENPRELPDPPG